MKELTKIKILFQCQAFALNCSMPSLVVTDFNSFPRCKRNVGLHPKNKKKEFFISPKVDNLLNKGGTGGYNELGY